MTCNKCGMVIPDGVAFCPECGASFANNAPQNNLQPAPQNNFQPASQGNFQPASQNGFQPASQNGFQPASQSGFQSTGYQEAPNNSFQNSGAFGQNAYSNNFQQPTYNSYQQNSYQDAAPVKSGYATPESEAFAGSALKFGIMGLAFGGSCLLSFLGIIFSAIAFSKARAFTAIEGKLYGKAKVGRGLAIGGIIVSIILTVYFVIIAAACVTAIGSVRRYGFY